VQEIAFRQALQLKPNLYAKVDDLHLAKFILSGWNYSLIEKQKMKDTFRQLAIWQYSCCAFKVFSVR
jgi:hypothetical protein